MSNKRKAVMPDLRLWGKLGLTDPNPYPVLSHMLDTSAAAVVIWDMWLRPGLRDLLTRALAPGNPTLARGMYAAVAGLHDIGKISPVFQLQQLNSRPKSPAQADFFAAHRDELATSRYRVSVPSVTGRAGGRALDPQSELARMVSRHEALSLQVVAETWPTRGSYVADAWVAAVIGGHHGRFNPHGGFLIDDDMLETELANPLSAAAQFRALTAGLWGKQQRAHIDAVLDAVDVAREDIDTPLTAHESETVILLAGLVTLADWLASAEDSVTAGRALDVSPLDGATWVRERVDQFRVSLPATLGTYDGFLNPKSDILASHAKDATELQRAALSAGDGLWIATVPTGDGKTEAALLRHAVRPDEGILFALPTRATTDAMFSRVRRYFANTRNAGALVHSYAVLDSYYAGGDDAVGHVESFDDCGHTRGLRPQEWLSSAGRGVFAPVAVSTCDQVLLGALRQNRSFLRLLALANRHIILDEVHTFDRYQQSLLEQLLAWWGATGTRVSMLSASLPTTLLNRYLAAYNEHARPVEPIYPGWTTTSGDDTGQGDVDSRRQYTLRFKALDTTAEHVVDTHVATVNEYRKMSDHTHIAVVVNTVDRCVDVARQLRLQGHNVLVLHSRMTAAHRKSVSDAIERMRVRTGGLLEGVIVVGTQTIESSLDVDFDHMVSDLAPTPSLIQRAGRLWRHSAVSGGRWDHTMYDPESGDALYLRKRHASSPRLDVVVMREPAKSRFLAVESRFPYLMAEQKRTLAALRTAKMRVHVPTGVQELVDASVPDECSLLEDTPVRDYASGVGVLDLVQEEAAAIARLSDAQNVVIPMRDHGQVAPLLDPDLDFGTLSRMTTPHEETESSTRFMEYDTADYLILDPTGENPWAWHGSLKSALQVRPGTDAARKLLSCTLSLRDGQAAKMTSPACEEDEWNPRVSVLRRVSPVTVAASATYDEMYGLWA